MSELHQVAAPGFGTETAARERATTCMPQDAIAWLIERLGVKPGRQIVDLAAGTGALTAPLADVGADIVAVEPVASMRDRFRERLPGVPVVAGIAEALPLADKSVDAVVVARAFHWFDARRAMDEIARVVRPGGRLGLIWHTRDRSVEWVDQVWPLMDRGERTVPWRDGGSCWSPWIQATFNQMHDSVPARVDAMYTERLG